MNRTTAGDNEVAFRRLLVGLGIFAILGIAGYAAVIPTIQGIGDTEFSQMFQGPSRFTSRHLVTTPGDVGDWHSHPGYVFNVVTAGEIVVEDGCGGEEVFRTNDAFEVMDGRVHRAINRGTENAVEYNMFVNPAGTPLTVFTGPVGIAHAGAVRQEMSESARPAWASI